MTYPANLANRFANLSHAEWRTLAEAGLNGDDFDRRLVSSTLDQVRIEPVYARARSASRKGSRDAVPWDILQRIDHPKETAANKQALEDLENGATGLALVFSGAQTARGYGLIITDLAGLERTLDNVMADHIRVRLEVGNGGVSAAALLVALAEQRGYDFGRLNWSLGLDPIGASLATGFAGDGLAPALADLRDMTSALLKRGFSGQTMLADGRPWHEAGASEAQELAVILATIILYLRNLEKAGIDPGVAWQRIEVALACDPDQFLGLAKLRALNLLLASIAQSCGIENPVAMPVHGESDWRSQTRYDPHVNMLRGTMSTFVAGTGGATSVTVLPFTSAIGLPGEFARRVARNTQLVLQEEANLWRVSDPLAGSGYGEELTNKLAGKAWGIFKKIETGGGIAAALDDGWLQESILETAEARATNMARGKDVLTGTTSFPNLSEETPSVLEATPGNGFLSDQAIDLSEAGDGDRFRALVESLKGGGQLVFIPPEPSAGSCTPLPSLRLAEPFEALRRQADQLATTDQRPLVFVAGLGPLKDFVARANWIENMLATGGVAAQVMPDLDDISDAVSAFKDSGAQVACICGPDAVYKDNAAKLAKALSGTGAELVCLAGQPGEMRDELTRADIKLFLHGGGDMIAALEAIHAVFGQDQGSVK